MSSSLILGYGNTLRSDDGVGWKVAAALHHELSSPEVTVIAAHQLTPEMAEPIAQAARVLFLDAAHTGIPGEICLATIRRDPQFRAVDFSHRLSPSELLELAHRHFGQEPEAALLTVAGENFELGERLSPQVEGRLNSFLECVRKWLSHS